MFSPNNKKIVLHTFLSQYPDQFAVSNAKWEDISQIVSPLGLGTKRAKALIRFSQEYISLTKQSDAFNLKKDEVMVSTSSIVCNPCFMNIQLNYFSL